MVVSGARAMFSCETREATSTGLCWQRRRVGEQTTLLCNHNGCRAHSRYSVDTSIYPRHSFMIDSVVATDSGRYSCEVCKNPRTERTAHLVVIGRSATALFERNVDWAHCWPVFCIGLFLGCVISFRVLSRRKIHSFACQWPSKQRRLSRTEMTSTVCNAPVARLLYTVCTHADDILIG